MLSEKAPKSGFFFFHRPHPPAKLLCPFDSPHFQEPRNFPVPAKICFERKGWWGGGIQTSGVRENTSTESGDRLAVIPQGFVTILCNNCHQLSQRCSLPPRLVRTTPSILLRLRREVSQPARTEKKPVKEGGERGERSSPPPSLRRRRQIKKRFSNHPDPTTVEEVGGRRRRSITKVDNNRPTDQALS